MRDDLFAPVCVRLLAFELKLIVRVPGSGACLLAPRIITISSVFSALLASASFPGDSETIEWALAFAGTLWEDVFFINVYEFRLDRLHLYFSGVPRMGLLGQPRGNSATRIETNLLSSTVVE